MRNGLETAAARRRSWRCTLLALALLPALAWNPAWAQVSEILTPLNPLAAPRDLTVDRGGNVYVLGAESGNVFHVAPSGAVREIFDLHDEGLGHAVAGLRGIAVGSDGGVYVTASKTDNALRIFPKPVVEVIRASGDGRGNALREPTGIASDPVTRDLYVVGSGSENVFRITPGGTVTRILGSRGDGVSPCHRPADIVIDRKRRVSVACEASNNVFRVSPTGAIREVVADGPSNRPLAFRPTLLATDSAANVYVGARSGVLRIAPTGEPKQIIGWQSGISFESLTGLVVDSAARVFVASSYRNEVYRIGPGGSLHKVLDGYGDGTHPLQFPTGLAIDASDNLYVLGGRSHNAFRIDPSGRTVQVLDAGGDYSWLHLRGPLPHRGPHPRR